MGIRVTAGPEASPEKPDRDSTRGLRGTSWRKFVLRGEKQLVPLVGLSQHGEQHGSGRNSCCWGDLRGEG